MLERIDGAGGGHGLRRRELLIGGALWGAASSASATPVVPVAVSESVNRPFVQEVLEQLAMLVPVRWDLQPVPFTRLLQMAERGQAFAFGIGRTPAREALLSFSVPLFYSRLWTVSLKGASPAVSRLSDLNGKRLCVGRYITFGAEVDAALDGKQVEPVYVNSDLSARLRVLKAGRCDALLMAHRNEEVRLLEQRLKEAGGDLNELVLSRQAIAVQTEHMAVAKGCDLEKYLQGISDAIDARRPQIQQVIARSL